MDYNSKFGYVPKMIFTLEQHLKNYAEIDVNVRRLLESFHLIKENMEVNLRPIISFFPHYSDHSHEHSERLLSSIEKLLGRNRIEKLSPSDTWMLLVCAYMHDLGMLIQNKEVEMIWGTEEFKNYISDCINSNDNEIRQAALHVQSIDWARNSLCWPVCVYRDVILLVSEFYRRKHPERSRILPQRTELKQALNVVVSAGGRIPQRVQSTVGKICFTHGISFEEMLEFLEPLDSLCGYTFHPRFVAALLCIGDLCDLDNGRFNNMAIEVFGGLTKNNLVHYYKHESVTSFVVESDMISVSFNIQNKRIKEEIRNKTFFTKFKDGELQDFCDLILIETQNWISWLTETVKNIKLYWNELYISDIDALSPTLTYKILVDGKETISSKKNMRFSFSNEKAYELIEGYNLYNDNFAFVRELLQNSIDALKKQLWIDIISGRWNHLLRDIECKGEIDYSEVQPYHFFQKEIYEYYRIKIYVEHDENEPLAMFIIEDNGIGITKEDIENRIINSGQRVELLDSFTNRMPEWLRPTSTFGIGLHAAFALTDTLFVQTRTESDQMVSNINMHAGKKDGYIFMSVAEDQNIRFCNCKCGTKIRLNIDVSKWREGRKIVSKYVCNPMEKCPESKFCSALQEKVRSMLHTSLFSVSFISNFDDEVTICNDYENSNKELFSLKNIRNHIFDETYNDQRYDFVLDMENGDVILWDKQKAIFMVYSIDGSEKELISVYCKGFKVGEINNYNNYYYGFCIAPRLIDYWGGDIKKILNISRDNLTQIQMENNKIIFSEARDFIAKIYSELLKELFNNSEIKGWHQDVEAFMHEWLQKKEQSIANNSFNITIERFYEKYNSLNFTEEMFQILFLKHGFQMMVRKYKKEIQDIFKDLVQEEQYKYIITCEILNPNNPLNEVLKKNSFFYEYIEESCSISNEEIFRTQIKRTYSEIFCSECADIIISFSSEMKEQLYLENLIYPFGTRNFTTSEYISFHFFVTRIKKQFSGSCLRFYLTFPLMKIVYLLICMNKDIAIYGDNVLDELSYWPGYCNNYGFIDVRNVGDIIMAKELKIEENKCNEALEWYLPFTRWLACKTIDIGENNELILNFSNICEHKCVINFKNDSFKKMLESHCHMNLVPVPKGYETIAMDIPAVISVFYEKTEEEMWLYGNYTTYLWLPFEDIKETYGQRIKNGEDKEVILDEIMPKSRTDKSQIVYIFRRILQNNVFRCNVQYEEAWENLCLTYRGFIALILDCIK